MIFLYLIHQEFLGGVFTYGGLDTANCGPVIAYYKLSNALYFQYEFDYVQIGPGSGITWESCIDDYNQYGDPNCPWTAISDTGTSFIGGPQSSTDNIAAEVGAEWDDEYVNFLRFF